MSQTSITTPKKACSCHHDHDEHHEEHAFDHEEKHHCDKKHKTTAHNHAAHEHEKHSHCGCEHNEHAQTIRSMPPSGEGNIRKQSVPAGYQLSTWLIEDMDCPVEEKLIRKHLATMDGISAMEFNLIQRTFTAIHRQEIGEQIIQVIASVGMQAVSTDECEESQTSNTQQHGWFLGFAGLALAITAELVEIIHGSEWLGLSLAVFAILLCGLTTYRKGLIAIKNMQLNINALMSIAVTGAVLIGKWPEAAMVMALFNISELLEARSLDKARQAIRALLELTPEKVTLVQADGSLLEIPPDSAHVGDIVQVRPGQRIALDGVITKGQTSINQSAITGESLPVDKVVGDNVFAGTLNAAGEFQFCITALSKDSTLARIIHAVEDAQSERAPTQRFIDQFARYYTPVVVLLAIAIAIFPPLITAQPWLEWIYKALVILVIACPCALVISTPITIVSALTSASKRGLLIKGGVYLENGRHLRWLALDKTGTITYGKPVQTDFIVLEKILASEENEEFSNWRQIACSLATRSDHPVSLAIVKAALKDHITPLEVKNFAAIAGQGTQGEIAGQAYALGNRKLLADRGLLNTQVTQNIDALEQTGKTVVALCSSTKALALFAVADTIKPSSRDAINQLHALGVNTLMLTGDNNYSAQTIAQQAGITEARGNLLPEDKQQAIQDKKQEMAQQGISKGMIGMVGDGINDAPALARADIGFAMGAAGTDTAMETADVAIMDDNLAKIPEFIRLSKRTYQILLQNISMALGIKLIFLLLTIAGLGTMWMAVFADVGTSLLVVFNGMRMLRISALNQSNTD